MKPEIQQSQREPHIIDRLVDIWESAVKATHTFLSESDIQAIKPDVRQGLEAIDSLYCFYDSNEAVQGFMGVENQKIEMLFVHADARGQGIGKEFVNFAINKLNAKFVDVNEQNDRAAGFYSHLGFQTVSRSEYDGQGRPFPILHMEYGQRKITSPAFFEPADERETQIGPFRIGGKYDETVQKQMEEYFGELRRQDKPDLTTAKGSPVYGRKFVREYSEFDYDSTYVFTTEDRIIEIKTDSVGKTGKGLEIGDSVDKAMSLYGRPTSQKECRRIAELKGIACTQEERDAYRLCTQYIYGSERKGLILYFNNKSKAVFKIKIINELDY